MYYFIMAELRVLFKNLRWRIYMYYFIIAELRKLFKDDEGMCTF